ncbi:MAG: hypothetical protein GX827_06910, partial [Clostridiales bacterium]|nr:hypothetical protein [Clostridiales bacterium]
MAINNENTEFISDSDISEAQAALESCGVSGTRDNYRIKPIPFTDEMKKEYKILIPNM